MEDEVLAAAEADIAAELSDHGASAETVLEFPGEGFEPDGTLHEEPEPEWNQTRSRNRIDPAPAEQELTGSYDHLWEQTVMRNIEDAAVREDPDADCRTRRRARRASRTRQPEPAADGQPRRPEQPTHGSRTQPDRSRAGTARAVRARRCPPD